jgi:carbon monoxide dehydrogenase subunit G
MGQLGGEASAEIEAPIEAVWAVVEDVASAPDWQDGLDSMEVLERDAEGRVEVANSTTDAKVRTVTTRVRFEYDPPHRVTWRQEKGDLKKLVGSWELEALGDGRTRATYRLDGDPGRMLGMLIRGPVEDKLRGILVGNRPEELVRRMARG